VGVQPGEAGTTQTALSLGATPETPSLVQAATPAALEPPALPSPEATSQPSGAATPVYGFQVVKSYPHDRGAFTQGLIFENGVLYEGTGLYGQSSLRRVDLVTGRVLQSRKLAAAYFGEGITVLGNKLVQLTWQSKVGFVYGRDSFGIQRRFTYPTEGWGITDDGKRLIMSDGTATLRWLDPQTYKETRTIEVRDENGPVANLNELEYIRGEIYANIWQTDRIARIDPQTGRVKAWIDLQGLLSEEDRREPVDVLNGIAYDAQHDRLFVTGKLWPKLFEIKLVPPK
jgi:glutamine cyclotransferase